MTDKDFTGPRWTPVTPYTLRNRSFHSYGEGTFDGEGNIRVTFEQKEG